jgi:hypothetical protein
MKNVYVLSITVVAFFCSALTSSLYAHPTDSVFVRQRHPHVFTGLDTPGMVDGLAYARADLDGTGIDEYLVTAYSNTVQNTVRYILLQSTEYQLHFLPDAGILPASSLA